jgi:hypothetical protein
LDISRMLHNTSGSLRLHKTLVLIVLLAVLTIVMALIGLLGYNDWGASGDPNLLQATPTPNADPLGGDIEGSGGGPLFNAPEYGVGGGIIAFAACLLAFGLFSLRKRHS